VDISINLDPDCRGRGLGAQVLSAVQDHVRRQGVDSLYAEVREGNPASARVFANAGFEALDKAEKHVEDTGETCAILRFAAELTPANWRRGGVYVIAEAGSNWRMGSPERDMAMARALIDVAVDAGADAVKFQTYRPETVYAENAGQSDYLAQSGIKQDIGEIFRDLSMPYEMVPALAEYCREREIDFMSTGFSADDFGAIDPHVGIHKIASYEISHPHLLAMAAATGKPLILSTGASTEEDIAWAVETFRAKGGRDLCLLQCTAKYPAPLNSLNIGAIPWLQRRFGVAAGLSDHSREPALAPVLAVALGARVVEKHYTLDNRLPGADHSFAIEPAELKEMIGAIRQAEQAVGDGIKKVMDDEKELASYARRGLQATRHIKAGEVFREGDNFDVLRPGQNALGVHPRHTGEIAGRKAVRAIRAGAGIRLDDATG
jgi:N-acetylneuraminate synthase